MSERAKVAEFVSFCIEMFAKAKRLSGDKVAVQSTTLILVMMFFTRRESAGWCPTLTNS